MAANAMTAGQLYRGNVGVARVVAADAVTPLAGKCFMIAFGELNRDLRMTFIASFPTREHRRSGCHFFERVTAVEATKFPEGRRREQLPGDEVRNDNPDGQKHQAENLRRHFETAHNVGF